MRSNDPLHRQAKQRPSAPAGEATTSLPPDLKEGLAAPRCGAETLCPGIRSNDPLHRHTKQRPAAPPCEAGAPLLPHAKQRPLPRDGESGRSSGEGTQRPSGSVGVGVPWSRGSCTAPRCGARHRRRKGVLEALSRQPGEFPISRQPAAPSLRGHGNSAPGLARGAGHARVPARPPAGSPTSIRRTACYVLDASSRGPAVRRPPRPLRSVGRSVARVARVARSPAVRRTPCRPRRPVARGPSNARVARVARSPAVRRTPVSPASPGRPRSVGHRVRCGPSVTASPAVSR